MAEKKIVILGGGFSGLACAEQLSRTQGEEKKSYAVTVVDKASFGSYVPTLTQITKGNLRVPFRIQREKILEQWGVSFFQGWASHIDVDSNLVKAGDETLPFDYLVFSLGAEPEYCPLPVGEKVPFYEPKTPEKACELEELLLRSIQDKRRMRIAILGGTSTGIEFAMDIACANQSNILSLSLYEAGKKILPGFADPVVSFIVQALQSKNVSVETNTRITRFGFDRHVIYSGKKEIPIDAVVWFGEKKVSALIGSIASPLRDGRILVSPEFQTLRYETIFGIGENASAGGQFVDVSRISGSLSAIVDGEKAAAAIYQRITGKTILSSSLPVISLPEGSYTDFFANNFSMGKIKSAVQESAAWLTQ